MLKNPALHHYQVGNPHPLAVDALAANASGVENQVTFVGPRADIFDWLWACDIHVMPSIFEGYGLAAVEALASGCDCLFADCPGLAYFKSLKLAANWARPNAQDFPAGLEQILRNRTPNSALATNSHLTCDLFDTKRRSQAYHKLWKRPVERKQP